MMFRNVALAEPTVQLDLWSTATKYAIALLSCGSIADSKMEVRAG
jgi:hypothetical protein